MGSIRGQHLVNTWSTRRSTSKIRRLVMLTLVVFLRVTAGSVPSCYRGFGSFMLPRVQFLRVTADSVSSCYRRFSSFVLPRVRFLRVTAGSVLLCYRGFSSFVLPRVPKRCVRRSVFLTFFFKRLSTLSPPTLEIHHQLQAVEALHAP
jgi:hypothetical protein